MLVLYENLKKKANEKMKTMQRMGRPAAEIKIPNGKFTFADLMKQNSHVTPVTLRKFLSRDADRKGKSQVMLVKGEFEDPHSRSGLGRKAFVYVARNVPRSIPSRSGRQLSRVPSGNTRMQILPAELPHAKIRVTLMDEETHLSQTYEATTVTIVAPTIPPVVASGSEPVIAPTQATPEGQPIAQTEELTAVAPAK